MSVSAKKIIPPAGKYGIVVLLCFVASIANGQVLDKIIAVVGKNRIILKSDLDLQIIQLRQQSPEFHDSCRALQDMILTRMIMEQGERDSVRVTDEDVEGQLENRLR